MKGRNSACPSRVLLSVADWKIEILEEEHDQRITPLDDLRRYGPLVLAFLLGWLAAVVVPSRIPLP